MSLLRATSRDRALTRLRRLRAGTVALTALLVGAFSDVAAHAIPGHATARRPSYVPPPTSPLPPVAPTLLKLGSTGYRFVHYYAGTSRYRRRGPPVTVLRATAPVLVASTVAVLASGVVLLLAGPPARPTGLPIHKLTFFAWLAAFGVHLLGHLPSLPGAVRLDYGRLGRRDGAGGRRLALLAALIAGVILAVLVLPDVPAWLLYRHARRAALTSSRGGLSAGALVAIVTSLADPHPRTPSGPTGRGASSATGKADGAPR